MWYQRAQAARGLQLTSEIVVIKGDDLKAFFLLSLARR